MIHRPTYFGRELITNMDLRAAHEHRWDMIHGTKKFIPTPLTLIERTERNPNRRWWQLWKPRWVTTSFYGPREIT